MNFTSEQIITVLLAMLVNVPTIYLLRSNRRKAEAEADSQEGEAVEHLSTASRTMMETYNKELLAPMQHRIEELVGQMSVIEEDRHTEKLKLQSDIRVLQNQVTDLLRQVDFLRGELRRSDTALELMLSIAKDAYPAESAKALKIRRGEL